MTTTVTDTIGSGGAYATPALWEDATDNTSLVTADEIRVGAIKAGEHFTNAGNTVTIAGATTDATRYRELTTDTGASFRDNASVQTNPLRWDNTVGAAISVTGNYATAVIFTENNGRLSKLQVRATAGSGRVPFSCGGSTIVDGCILESESGTPSFQGTTTKVKNTLICNRKASIAATILGSFCTLTLYQCTVVTPDDLADPTQVFSASVHNTITCNNCAFFGHTALKSTGTVTFSNCYSDVSGTGITQVTYDSTLFENINDATRDFRLKSGSSLINTVTADTTNAPTDIAGTTRPTGATQADVGCWEYVAAGGATVYRKMCLLGAGI